MDFEETLEFLRSIKGKTVDVAVRLRVEGRDEPESLLSISGVLGELKPSPSSRPSGWRAWIERSGPPTAGPEMFYLDRDLFESADHEAHVPPPDERSEMGTWWTLEIRQHGGLITEVLVYV
jgi:hypothetical protein